RENPCNGCNRGRGQQESGESPESCLRNRILNDSPQQRERIMANVLSVEDQILVLHHLVEGTSIRSITRVTGIHKTTILKLLVRFGSACREFLDQQMRGLELRHLECDEQWTFVFKKQGRLTPDDGRNARIGDQYLWLAIDMDTKLIPSFIIGKRSA